MTHLAEVILSNIEKAFLKSALFKNVKRSNVFPHDPLDLPQINILQGEDKIVGDESTIGNRVFVSELTIQFLIHVAFSEEIPIEKQLSDIRADINILLCGDLFTDPTIDIFENQASKPEISRETEFQAMTQELEYLVLYRRKQKDPTQ